VELGAGTGYWARCLRGAGAAVAAYDAAPPGPRGAANAYHGRVPAVSQARWAPCCEQQRTTLMGTF
jgi:hypothetical protein